MAWRASAVIGRIIKVAFQLASSVALAAIGTGCTTTTVHTFYKVQNPVVDRAFVKPGVDWSTYRHLQPDSLSIVYVEGWGKTRPGGSRTHADAFQGGVPRRQRRRLRNYFVT